MPDKNDQEGQKTDNEFPGYPHYPAAEDIMGSKEVDRIDLNVEDISRSTAATMDLSGTPVKPMQSEDQESLIDNEEDEALEEDQQIDDTDITQEDLLALGEDDATAGSMEKAAGNDLDVPGTEDDDANEEIGEEDEENNYYSLGGDAHENLDEDPGSDS